MRKIWWACLLAFSLALPALPALADSYSDTAALFENAGASATLASAGTGGSTASASGGKKDATTADGYQKGVAVFTITKGGLMYQAAVAGQKFSYTPK